MPDKQRIIKLFIFSIVVFTLLLNLVNSGYAKYCEKYYTAHNIQVASDFHKYWRNEIDHYRKSCLNLKPDLFLPTHNTLSYWSGLMIWISILIMIVVKIASKISRRKMFSKKDKYILLGIIFLSFSMYYFYVGLMELNYHYFGWDCSRFLL